MREWVRCHDDGFADAFALGADADADADAGADAGAGAGLAAPAAAAAGRGAWGWRAHHAWWVEARHRWLVRGVGLRAALLRRDVHPPDKLAHYARATTDIEFRFPFGWQELEGVAARGDYDLRQHQAGSGRRIGLEGEGGERGGGGPEGGGEGSEGGKGGGLPLCIEPSVGVDRLCLALLCSAYRSEGAGKNKRVVLGLHPRVAPLKAAVLPLAKNQPALQRAARALLAELQGEGHAVAFDDAGSIGRRYRRMDEVGTPFCITVDFQTLEDGTVTVRERDSMTQLRVLAFDVGGGGGLTAAAAATAEPQADELLGLLHDSIHSEAQ
jgi:glycyl-tRNA synthetase